MPRVTDNLKEIEKNMGRRLREMRIVRGLSRQQVARMLSEGGDAITHQQFAKYESGTNRLPASRMPALADSFGVLVSDFFAPHDIKESNPRNRRVIEAARTLADIKDPDVQDSIVDLIRKLNKT